MISLNNIAFYPGICVNFLLQCANIDYCISSFEGFRCSKIFNSGIQQNSHHNYSIYACYVLLIMTRLLLLISDITVSPMGLPSTKPVKLSLVKINVRVIHLSIIVTYVHFCIHIYVHMFPWLDIILST